MSPTIGIDVGSALTGHQAAPPGVRAVICSTRTANPGAVGQRHLQRQRAKLQAETAVHGWTAWIEDLHQSGTTLDRPGLQHALVLLAGHPPRRAAGHRRHPPGRRRGGHQPARGARRPARLAAPDRHPHTDVHHRPGCHGGGPHPRPWPWGCTPMLPQPRPRGRLGLRSLAAWSLGIGLAWLLLGQQGAGQPVVRLDLTAGQPGASSVHGRPAAPARPGPAPYPELVATPPPQAHRPSSPTA
jgi:hypothetical protein